MFLVVDSPRFLSLPFRLLEEFQSAHGSLGFIGNGNSVVNYSAHGIGIVHFEAAIFCSLATVSIASHCLWLMNSMTSLCASRSIGSVKKLLGLKKRAI